MTHSPFLKTVSLLTLLSGLGLAIALSPPTRLSSDTIYWLLSLTLLLFTLALSAILMSLARLHADLSRLAPAPKERAPGDARPRAPLARPSRLREAVVYLFVLLLLALFLWGYRHHAPIRCAHCHSAPVATPGELCATCAREPVEVVTGRRFLCQQCGEVYKEFLRPVQVPRAQAGQFALVEDVPGLCPNCRRAQ